MKTKYMIVNKVFEKITYKKLIHSAEKSYQKDKNDYNSLTKNREKYNFIFNSEDEFPCKMDKFESAGRLDMHYYLQDIWMARQVAASKVTEHYDIGSRVDGFISHLLSHNIVVNMIDIRSIEKKIENLNFTQADATNLDSIPSESIASISSLHAIEHFGLGRYGDAIDPDAWIKVLKAMERVLCIGGKMYVSVPIGKKEKVCFNAHRIFDVTTIPKYLEKMKLSKFAYISDFKIYEKSDIGGLLIDDEYSCGMYVFEKQ